jgi:hypothetical protein
LEPSHRRRGFVHETVPPPPTSHPHASSPQAATATSSGAIVLGRWLTEVAVASHRPYKGWEKIRRGRGEEMLKGRKRKKKG